MDPWKILGIALVAPIKKINLVMRFFGPAFVLIILCEIIPDIYYLFFTKSNESEKLLDFNIFEKITSFEFSLIIAIVILIYLISIALIVFGLIKWHRYHSLGEDNGRANTDILKRAWQLFIQWFIVGLGFVFFII